MRVWFRLDKCDNNKKLFLPFVFSFLQMQKKGDSEIVVFLVASVFKEREKTSLAPSIEGYN